MASVVDITIGVVIGAAGGAVSGMLGIGGGSLITPALSLFLGIPQHIAQSISLGALLPPVGLPSLRVYLKNGVRIVWPCVWMLILGFVVGSAVGGVIAHRVPERELRFAFAGMLLCMALAMIIRSLKADPPAIAADPNAKTNPNARRWTALPIGAIGGLLSGIFGIGGGIVVVPLLRRFGGFARLESQALSLAMMLPPIGLPALFVYADQQHGLRWGMVAAVAGGFTLGSFGGARIGVRISPRTASRVFATLLVLSAVALLARPRG